MAIRTLTLVSLFILGMILGRSLPLFDSSVDEYGERIAETTSHMDEINRNSGAAPNIAILDNSASEIVQSYLQKLTNAEAEINALLVRWEAIEPPERFQLYHDLNSQGFQKTAEATNLERRAYEDFNRQIDQFSFDPTVGNDLLQQGRYAMTEAKAFIDAAAREGKR